jgi:hypothetical protein
MSKQIEDSIALPVYRNLSFALSIFLSFIVLMSYFAFSICEVESNIYCTLQKFFLICISILLLLNMRFGHKALYLSLTLLSAILGLFSSVMLTCNHICVSSPSFGKPLLGLSIYSWSMILFSFCIVCMSFLLMTHKENKIQRRASSEDLLFKIGLTLGILCFIIELVYEIKRHLID